MVEVEKLKETKVVQMMVKSLEEKDTPLHKMRTRRGLIVCIENNFNLLVGYRNSDLLLRLIIGLGISEIAQEMNRHF